MQTRAKLRGRARVLLADGHFQAIDPDGVNGGPSGFCFGLRGRLSLLIGAGGLQNAVQVRHAVLKNARFNVSRRDGDLRIAQFNRGLDDGFPGAVCFLYKCRAVDFSVRRIALSTRIDGRQYHNGDEQELFLH